MAEGCNSVVEMTVSACLVQEHAHLGVMAKGKNLPRLDVSKAGQGSGIVGLTVYKATYSFDPGIYRRSRIARSSVFIGKNQERVFSMLRRWGYG